MILLRGSALSPRRIGNRIRVIPRAETLRASKPRDINAGRRGEGDRGRRGGQIGETRLRGYGRPGEEIGRQRGGGGGRSCSEDNILHEVLLVKHKREQAEPPDILEDASP